MGRVSRCGRCGGWGQEVQAVAGIVVFVCTCGQHWREDAGSWVSLVRDLLTMERAA